MAKSDYSNALVFLFLCCCYFHKENFVNIELLSLIREFETLPSHHNDRNKMKGKNILDQNPPFGPLEVFFFFFLRGPQKYLKAA